MNAYILFSVVRPDVKKRLLIRAAATGFPGILLLLAVGGFSPVESLSKWGIFVFTLGIFLIAWGMIPYRKLSRLETKPHKIEFSEKGMAGIAFKSIENLTYVERKTYYGIRLEMKNGKRIYFPYFSKSAYTRLNDVMHANETD